MYSKKWEKYAQDLEKGLVLAQKRGAKRVSRRLNSLDRAMKLSRQGMYMEASTLIF